MKALILVLLLSVSVLGQKLPRAIEAKYDKFRNETTITLIDGQPPWDSLSRGIRFKFEGQTLTKNVDQFQLFTFTTSSRACSGFCFDRSTSFILLTDNKRLTFEDSRNTMGNYVVFELTREQLQQMASAQVIEYQVGRFEGKWKQNNIDKIKMMLDLATIK